ncbi:YtxH domain-containing protein [Flavobacterium sufflavum]|uniref:YtxH domain-containing protein n=1 Tax=Flavobacterium sufflavum TaxID=1921138 RepID=A0A3S2UKK9_9FLAO|nr:YtxH domain-containing protein [Flavobacterium sufflavum]RVT72243.1 YtxH domain-containing protein [Flavobacterium sufflavum]
MKTNKVVLGLIGGLVTGAALGILFAPQSGRKTRRKIKDKSREFKDHMKEDFDKLIQKIDKKYESVSHNAHEFFHNGKAKIENETTTRN